MKALACLLFALGLLVVQPGLAADPAPASAEPVAPADAPELVKLREALKGLEADKATAADAFVRIYEVFRKGEELATAGDVQNAKVRFEAALAALQTLRKLVPEWNRTIVEYRMKKTEEKLAALDPDRQRQAAAVQPEPLEKPFGPKLTPVPPGPAPARKAPLTFEEQNRERAPGRKWTEREFNREKLYVVPLMAAREAAGYHTPR
jgi:hypothetical protein